MSVLVLWLFTSCHGFNGIYIWSKLLFELMTSIWFNPMYRACGNAVVWSESYLLKRLQGSITI